MALWLGGLALLLVCVLGRDAHATLVPVMPRFSRLALGCFALLGVTGVYLAWRQSGELAALPATEFGRLLLIKSAIVLVIIGLAVLLAPRGRQRMGGDVARRLRRTVLAEAILGVVVLGVTATLVNAAPARVSYAPPLDVTVPAVDGGQVAGAHGAGQAGRERRRHLPGQARRPVARSRRRSPRGCCRPTARTSGRCRSSSARPSRATTSRSG